MISSFCEFMCGGWFTKRTHVVYVKVLEADKGIEITSFSLLPADVIKEVLSLLDVRDVVRLDSALVNHNLRQYFYACLRKTVLVGVVDFRHLDWCKDRKCSATTLRVSSSVDKGGLHIHDSRFSFKTLELCRTANVSEQALSSLLAAGCRNLNFQLFHCVHHHPLSFDVDLLLLEIHMHRDSFLHEDTLVGIIKRCPQLRVINAKGCIHYTKRLRFALAEHCHLLREIIMSIAVSGENVQADGCKKLFQYCKRLKLVDFSGCFTIAHMQSLANSCRELTSVTLQSNSYFTQDDETHSAELSAALTTLAMNNVTIHTLNLSLFPSLSDACLQAVAQNLPLLHTFTLSFCKASLTGLSAIRDSCAKLKVFEVYRQLCVFTTQNVADYRYVQLSMITELAIKATTLKDAELISLSEANPNMRALCISPYGSAQGTALSSYALCKALSNLHNLETCELWTWQTSHHDNFPIRSIRIDDTMLYTLAQYCKKLSSLCIHGHANLTNAALSALSTLPLLRILDTGHCANLLDSSVVAITEHCPLLEEVDFSYCTRISNVSINALAQYCRRLTRLTLEACTGIHNCAIQNLILHARQLQVLDITGNSLITFNAVAELPVFCPCMRTLRLFKAWREKTILLELFPAYRSNRRYFDIIFGWSKERRGV